MGLIAAAAQLQGASLVVASVAVWIGYSFVQRARKRNRLPPVCMDSPTQSNGHHRVQDDRLSIGILLALYTLQGVPMGLCASLPVILKEKGIGFEDLALLSISSIPFSLKLLWAPIVDCKFFPSIGRRKSWLVPVQFLCGLVFLLGSSLVDFWMENSNVLTLTAFFVFLYFLMATQDIAVGTCILYWSIFVVRSTSDGWALTMLSHEHVGYASVCNSIGQSFGFFLANQVFGYVEYFRCSHVNIYLCQGFIALNDAKWCHAHLGLAKGQALVDLSSFMHFWGWIFILATIFIFVGKEEREVEKGHEPDGLIETYQHIVSIFRLHPVQILTLILLSSRIAFAPADAAWVFKLMEAGLPKADVATISPLLLLIGLLLPAVLSRLVTSDPLYMFRIGYPLKLVTSLLGWFALGYCKEAFSISESPSWIFYASITGLMMLNEVAGQLIFISTMAFFAKISDPSIGGTYMTLLNTLSNLGFKWPNVVSLWLLPKLTWSSCVSPVTGEKWALDCVHSRKCINAGGNCDMHIDGYTIQTMAALSFGVAWFFLCSRLLNKLGSIPSIEWLVKKRS